MGLSTLLGAGDASDLCCIRARIWQGGSDRNESYYTFHGASYQQCNVFSFPSLASMKYTVGRPSGKRLGMTPKVRLLSCKQLSKVGFHIGEH